MRIRPALPGDLPLLAEIERHAARRFTAEDIPPPLRDTTLPAADLRRAQAAGMLWVAQAVGEVVGFVMAERVDSALHIVELSVLPEHGGAGLGRALMAAAMEQARAIGLATVTLTTFAHLPWNRPFYERLGFVVVPEARCSAHLAAQLAAERAAGLRQRVAMRCEPP